jgi:hypothetical protein
LPHGSAAALIRAAYDEGVQAERKRIAEVLQAPGVASYPLLAFELSLGGASADQVAKVIAHGSPRAGAPASDKVSGKHKQRSNTSLKDNQPMTTTAPHLSRAAQVAAVHLGPINASRKRAGLAPLAAAEVEVEFADVDRVPVRKTVATRTTSSTGAPDAMWSGIVARLNKAASASRAPMGAGRTSPASSGAADQTDAVVDWSAISSALNREAGLAKPVRSRAR